MLKKVGLAGLSILLAGAFGFSSAYAELKNIDKIILENAAKSHVVMFGGYHFTKADNEYVKFLLPYLNKFGYNKIAFEIDSFQQSRLDSYLNGKINMGELEEIIPYIESMSDVLEKSKELGMDVYSIDERYVSPKVRLLPGEGPPSDRGTDRNLKMSENIGRMIFDKEPDARLIVFIGSVHLAEEPTEVYHCLPSREPQKMLGYFLSERTSNYTVNLVEMRPLDAQPYNVDLNVQENKELSARMYPYYFMDDDKNEAD